MRAWLLFLVLAAAAAGGEVAAMARIHAGSSPRQGWGALGIPIAVMALRGGGEEAPLCLECGLPEEFCEYNEECRRPKAPRARGASPNKNVEPPRSRGASPNKNVEANGEHSSEDVSEEDQAAHDQAEKDRETKRKHDADKGKRKAKPKVVTIKVDKRRARKFVTTVSGIEHFLGTGETLKDAAKMLAGMLAAGASAVKGENGQPDHIVIQGDRAEEVSDFCAGKLKVPTGSIKITY